MFFRIVFLFLLFFSGVFAFSWVVFRTKFFNANRVLEVVKAGALISIAAIIAVVAIAVIMSAE